MMHKTEMAGLPRDGLPKSIALLHDPAFNKGTAFTASERDVLGLRGLLPLRVFSQEEQHCRVLENVRRKPTSLEKYIHLTALHHRNAGGERS